MGNKIINSLKLTFSMAFPMIIQGIVFQLQSLTDKAFLGHLDTKYISALGAAQFPFFMVVESLIAVGTGVVIYVSHLYGKNEKSEAATYVKSFIFYMSCICLVFFAVWFCLPKQIFYMLSVNPLVMDYCVTYVKICSFIFIGLGVDIALQAFLQGIGDTKPIMYVGIIKVVLNIILTGILVFGINGFQGMGVAGAAIGTLISNVVAAIMLIIYCFWIKKEYMLCDKIHQMFQREPFVASIKLGLPTGMEFLLWHVSNLLLIKFLNGFNYQAMAIYTLTVGIEGIVYAIFNGTAKANMTVMGQEIGAGRYKEANFHFYISMNANIIIEFFILIVFILYARPILSVFSNDIEIIEKSAIYLIITGVIMIFQSGNVVIGTAIRSYGDTRFMLYSQIFGSFFVVTLSSILVLGLHMDIMAIYITFFCDEAARSIINLIYFRVKYAKPDTILQTQ